MDKIERLYSKVKETAKSQQYLELGEIDHLNLLYPLQILEYEEWMEIEKRIVTWNEQQRQVLADSLVKIRDNKKSNYDTSALYIYLFTLANDLNAKTMLTNFNFIDNLVPKRIELIDKLMERLKKLNGKTTINNNFRVEYKLIHKLYNKAIC